MDRKAKFIDSPGAFYLGLLTGGFLFLILSFVIATEFDWNFLVSFCIMSASTIIGAVVGILVIHILSIRFG